ncbi:hypothetical protein ZIOFF_073726 [Zingiber officinale]|uniref:Uncharacterized protein n=1 Tax=Zingiber officinale TaxID=94328 RepID=A0A8J5BCH0_ZINOF|nr:hypothetical protein ZIOFF_073726 [Zingiber officinale]
MTSDQYGIMKVISTPKEFLARETSDGMMVNVVEGLKLYEKFLDSSEVTELVSLANEMRASGHRGELPETAAELGASPVAGVEDGAVGDAGGRRGGVRALKSVGQLDDGGGGQRRWMMARASYEEGVLVSIEAGGLDELGCRVTDYKFRRLSFLGSQSGPARLTFKTPPAYEGPSITMILCNAFFTTLV